MKWVVWGLLFINFALFGFFQASNYIKQQEEPETVSAGKPANDGAIKVLSDEDLAAMPRRAPEPEPSPVVIASCYELSNLAAADAAVAQSTLQQAGVDFEVRTTYEISGDTRFWVYIPPQKTLERAQDKLNELNALGITDSIIVKDKKWQNAISLGVFKNEALATDFMKTLHNKGVKSAIKAKRNGGASEVSLIVKQVLPAQAEKLAKVKLGRGSLKPIDCN
ncbi:MAG: SPOR domain-containing protein [Methylophilaceae bacterium]